MVRQGRTIYFAHPVFSQYARNAPRWCKQLFLNALDLLLPDPLVRVASPSTLLTALNRQGPENRLVLHLLHYIPERPGADFDVVEGFHGMRGDGGPEGAGERRVCGRQACASEIPRAW